MPAEDLDQRGFPGWLALRQSLLPSLLPSTVPTGWHA